MARFFERNLPQTATVWTATTVDSAGDSSYDPPRTISVRWEDRTDLLVQEEGEQITSLGIVITPEDLTVGDYLFLGTSISADPRGVDGAFQIKSFKKIPTRSGKAFLRRYTL